MILLGGMEKSNSGDIPVQPHYDAATDDSVTNSVSESGIHSVTVSNTEITAAAHPTEPLDMEKSTADSSISSETPSAAGADSQTNTATSASGTLPLSSIP